MEEQALEQGLFMVPEFQFEHCFYQMSNDNFRNEPSSAIMDIYQRCSQFLHLDTRPDSGITVIMTNSWIFVALLMQPYATAPNGFPVYLDGFDFAGLVSLQTTDSTWPATAGLEN